MTVVSVQQLAQFEVIQFFKKHWGSAEMVISSGIYDCSQLEGFAYINEKSHITGLVTYVIRGLECEIISLDSIQEGKGIGSKLVQEVEKIALQNDCTEITLVTTNDNLRALKFYQKRNYHLVEILQNAVDKARGYKTEIPRFGYDGIPIRDEIRLQKILKGK